MNFKSLVIAAALVAIPTVASASTLAQIQAASYELYRDGVPICSGQFVTPTEFLTAAHCLAHSKDHNYSIVTENSRTVQVYLLEPNIIDVLSDAATMKLSDKSAAFPFVEVAPATIQPEIGDPVIMAGYPGVLDYFLVSAGTFTGIVISPPELLEKPTVEYLVGLSAVPGSSGSGLYADVAGEWFLIGTETGGPSDNQDMNFTSTIVGVRGVL